MKLKLKMSMQILVMIKKCLTLVIIQLIQYIMVIQTNGCKMKDEKAGVSVENLSD